MNQSTPLADSMGYWRSLSVQAASGTLQIPEETAFQCEQACRAYIEHLQSIAQRTEFLVDVEAFGELPSAQQLGRKFERIAYSGDRSLRVVLGQHIEVIELMRSVFTQYFDEADYRDRRTGETIEQIAHGGAGR